MLENILWADNVKFDVSQQCSQGYYTRVLVKSKILGSNIEVQYSFNTLGAKSMLSILLFVQQNRIPVT